MTPELSKLSPEHFLFITNYTELYILINACENPPALKLIKLVLAEALFLIRLQKSGTRSVSVARALRGVQYNVYDYIQPDAERDGKFVRSCLHDVFWPVSCSKK